MSLNPEKVYAKFRDIHESVARLRQFSTADKESFLANRDHQDIACYRLIVATEAAIDLCLHLSAKLLQRVADEYAACFRLLAEAGIIDEKLAIRLSRMARFRNLLVHHYWRIDYTRLFEIITGPDLEDLHEFVREISLLLTMDGGEESC
jgi:uncharacterized protein YutE (UPF0331/DUF86 family)